MKKLIVLAACAAAFGLARPARAQEPTPARLAAAQQLINSVPMESIYRRTMDQMLAAQLRQNPEMARFQGTMRTFFDKYLSWNDVRGDMARAYALTYTEDEMRQLGAFYQTPLGRRLLETTPELSARTSELTQTRLMQHMPELMSEIMTQMTQTPSDSTARRTP